MGDNNNESQVKAQPSNSMEKLEEALTLCKFGKFHARLLFTSLMVAFGTTMVTTTSSYILPNAECDLNMNIMQKGLLNGMPFFGQVSGTLFSGFLVDAFGRRLFLVGGNAGIFIFSVLEGSSQTYTMMLIMKFIEGFALSFCVSASVAMVTEYTHKGVRDRVFMFQCTFMPLSLINISLISWGILPHRDWHFVIWKGYFELYVWNIYLYVCSIFSLIAAVFFYTIPESPKYLLSHGQEFEALEVLKRVYHENTGEPKETFPITSLSVEGAYKPTDKTAVFKQIRLAMCEVKELFKRPLVFQLILFCVLTFVCLLGYSSLRLWYPQLSTIIESYQRDHGEAEEFCVMINHYNKNPNITVTQVNDTAAEICVPDFSGTETYINQIILGLVSFVSIGMSGYLVEFLGQKPLIFITFLLCSACSAALYWTSSSLQIAILISATCAFMMTALSLVQNVLVRVFPTTLRALALSMILMTGRIGSLLGNILFPVLLEIGCMAPFFALSGITLGVAASVYFLPNPSKENKQTGDK